MKEKIKKVLSKKVYIAISCIILIAICIGIMLFFRNKNDIDGINKNAFIKSGISVKYNSSSKKTTIRYCDGDYRLYEEDSKYYCVVKDYSLSLKKTISYHVNLSTSEIKKQVSNVITPICESKGYNSYKVNKSSIVSTKGSVLKTSYEFTCKKRIKYSTEKFVVPYYNQGDYKNVYSACGGGYLSSKGCQPTNDAMIFSALLDKTITPVNINSVASDLVKNGKKSGSATFNNGVRICDSNSYYADFAKLYATNNKLQYKILSNIDSIDKLLKTGKCTGLAPLSKKSKCSGKVSNVCDSNVGHFVSFYASEKTNYANINDPSKSQYVKYEASISEILKSTQNYGVTVYCKPGVIESTIKATPDKLK